MRTVQDIDREIDVLKAKLGAVKGSQTEVYSRIVGYYRSVKNWNKGKREEYGERKQFSAPVHCTAEIKEMPSRNIEQEISKEAANGYMYFYRKTCPNCPPVKNYLDTLSLEGKLVDVDSPEGIALAAQHQVMASPTAIFFNEQGKEVYRSQKADQIQAYIEGTNKLAV